jgi:hypothetical protein
VIEAPCSIFHVNQQGLERCSEKKEERVERRHTLIDLELKPR